MNKIVSVLVLSLFAASLTYAADAPPVTLPDMGMSYGVEDGSGAGSNFRKIENVICGYKPLVKMNSAQCTYGSGNTLSGKSAWNLMQKILAAQGARAKCTGKKCGFTHPPLTVVCRYPLNPAEEGAAPPSCNVQEPGSGAKGDESADGEASDK